MRTLILGGAGMLGVALTVEGRRRGWPVLALHRGAADIRDRARLRWAAEEFRPDLVVNCAAFTRVDDCETQTGLAFEINGAAVANVAATAAGVGARLVQVSTDYVFDGAASRPYRPSAEAAPLSVYGESKRAGEIAALEYERALVVRTSWLFGPGGSNFVRTLVGALAGGRSELEVVDDQVGRPTYTSFLARGVLDLVVAGARGVHHYANRQPASWHGLAVDLVDRWGSGAAVEAVSTAEMPRPARRPAYSVLDVTETERLLGRRVERWDAGLAEYLELLRKETVKR